MPQSPQSQHRASLIRQMARDLKKTRPATGSSRGSSRASNGNNDSDGSFFDPENEALASTKQINDFSQRLPELRASAKKYKYHSQNESDIQINTSAIHRAFPDFSQGPTSSEDESQSIETGRAAALGPSAAGAEFSSMGFGDSLDMSPAIRDRIRKAASPLQHLQAPKPGKETSGFSRQELQTDRMPMAPNKSTPVVKASDQDSNGSRQGNGQYRRTIADLHAQVVDEEDATKLSDDRPSTINLTSRSSRFTGSKMSGPQPLNALPTSFSSSKDLLHQLNGSRSPKGKPAKARTVNATVSSINQGTQQSFVLPDMPNISELVSGVFEDGTPVFSARSKHPNSRFSGQPARMSGLSHIQVASIPIPEDEQAIYVSLKLLQEKVEGLESSKAEAEALIQRLEGKNEALEREKADRRRLRRSDSALGITSGSDAGDESNYGSRRSHIEKSRLESSVQHLQEKLSTSKNHVILSETTIKELTRERDSAITQLGVAYLTTEQLKMENHNLGKENETLKEELARMLAAKNSGAKSDSRGAFDNVRRDISQAASAQERTLNREQDFTRILDVEIDGQARAMSHASHASHADRILASRSEELAKSPRKKQKTRLVLEEYSESELTEDNVKDDATEEHNLPPGVRIAEFRSGRVGAVGDLTCLTTKSEKEFFSSLRTSLERDRRDRKARVGGREAAQIGNGDNSMPFTNPSIPRKSSKKDLTDQADRHAKRIELEQENRDTTKQSRVSSSQRPRHSDHSLLEQRSRQGGARMEDMTSAFIVPDITIYNSGQSGPVPDQISTSQDGLASNHKIQNCAICQRVLEHGKTHKHTSSNLKMTVPKPVPVSMRAPSPTPSNPDPTLRPSQSPGLALASVIKSLSDEISHLKAQLAKKHTLYNQHDPALSKRKRQAVCESMETLMRTINAISEQVYSLYDVLEGQRRSGQEMSEREVEVTLQSVGIDPVIMRMNLRGGGGTTDAAAGMEEDVDVVADASSFNGSDCDSTEELVLQNGAEGETRPLKSALKDTIKKTSADGNEKKHVWDLDSNATDSLPWEGCESTGDFTRRSRGSPGARKGS